MATEPTPQRVYRAACPNCGAPVDFRSPASAFAVCSFCKSTIVREGDALRRTGQSAELFDDHTPLQLGASGIYLKRPFTLVGRLQYRTDQGTWNEWHLLFDAGPDGVPRPAWLSEDNGRYVLSLDAPLAEPAPALDRLVAGQPLTIAGQTWSVASVVQATLIAAQGELPSPPVTDRPFGVVDLRNVRDEVATLDYSDAAKPRWSLGRAVAISELAMKGLAEASEKTLKARGVECPNCGTSLEVKLDSTQSIVCHNCKAVVDLSGGVGADLQHYVQGNAQDGGNPQIPLGSTGSLALGGAQALPWQVVGYVERCEIPEDAEDEQTCWREYLLFNRNEGFAFIVDAEDGWSWTAPITGVPERAGDGVKYKGVLYRKLYDYKGRVTYVLGEFYWKLERDQLTDNTDYQGSGGFAQKRLNRERTGEPGGGGPAQEIVWSGGETMSADVVLKAFKLAPELGAAFKRDALPTSSNASSLLAKMFFWVFVIVVLLMLFRCGSSDDCDGVRSSFGASSSEYQSCMNNNRSRTSGGAFGGFSSGGSHK